MWPKILSYDEYLGGRIESIFTKFPIYLNRDTLTLKYNQLGFFDWNIIPNKEFASRSKIKIKVILLRFCKLNKEPKLAFLSLMI